MGNNKTVKPLPEGFMSGFSSAINSQLAVEQSIKRPEMATGLVEEIYTLQRKIAIAQGGGVGDVAKLSRQLGEAKNRLINEAKMKDAEVLAAAKKLASNGKDEKAKKFGQGLVDFYGKNKSFTPDQVAGLQNIMKNASFQLAKEETQLDEKAPEQKRDDLTKGGISHGKNKTKKPGPSIEFNDEDGSDLSKTYVKKSKKETEKDLEEKAPVTKKLDDGEGMDPVGKGDADIDNDGDTDSSDKYLHKRRKAIGKAMKRESVG